MYWYKRKNETRRKKIPSRAFYRYQLVTWLSESWAIVAWPYCQFHRQNTLEWPPRREAWLPEIRATASGSCWLIRLRCKLELPRRLHYVFLQSSMSRARSFLGWRSQQHRPPYKWLRKNWWGEAEAYINNSRIRSMRSTRETNEASKLPSKYTRTDS